jgi:hypothetical protein
MPWSLPRVRRILMQVAATSSCGRTYYRCVRCTICSTTQVGAGLRLVSESRVTLLRWDEVWVQARLHRRDRRPCPLTGPCGGCRRGGKGLIAAAIGWARTREAGSDIQTPRPTPSPAPSESPECADAVPYPPSSARRCC